MDKMNDIPKGYAVSDENDLDFYHDPLAGTIDPETGMRYATDEEVRDMANQLTEMMLDAFKNLSVEEKAHLNEYGEKALLCKTPEESARLFDEYFPEYKGRYYEMFGGFTSLEVPDF